MDNGAASWSAEAKFGRGGRVAEEHRGMCGQFLFWARGLCAAKRFAEPHDNDATVIRLGPRASAG